MTEEKKKNKQSPKWNTRFHLREARLKIDRKNDVLVEIECKDIYRKSITRVAEAIEEEGLCEECKVHESTIELHNPDEGMIIAVGMTDFLQEAFLDEGYNVNFEG